MRHELRTAARILALSLREALRNKVGLLLLFLIPGLFLGIVRLTAGHTPVPIDLFFPKESLRLLLGQQEVSLVFVSASVSGFLSAYFALTLFQQDFGYWRYCVFLGLRPSTLLAGRLGFFLSLATLLAGAIALVLGAMVELHQPLVAFAGYLAIATIYGLAGAIAGTLSRDFLIAVLASALLADIDAAWLQNPVYYTAAERMELIRWMPAYYPTQLVFSAAFTERMNWHAVFGCAAWAALLLVLLLSILLFKLRGIAHQG